MSVYDLTGRKALVTGGARGLGAGMAEALARAGAAVVIGGASLTGGLASPLSTWAAAFFLAGLNQMMRVMGLPTALQFVVFGIVIIGVATGTDVGACSTSRLCFCPFGHGMPFWMLSIPLASVHR